MAEYVELIDKYLVTRGEYGTPSSYKWVDNTGAIVRCKDCAHNHSVCMKLLLPTQDDFFCAFGKRRGGDAK